MSSEFPDCQIRQRRNPLPLGNIIHLGERPPRESGSKPEEGFSRYSAYRLPDYQSEAAENPLIERGAEDHPGYGIIYPERWQMIDEGETQYDVLRCEAENPRTNIWIVKDTAWGTQTEGLNTDVARKLMGMGFNVLIKGPEIGTSLPLSQSAFNTHKLLDAQQRRGVLNASQYLIEGYSRGSMIAFGTSGYSHRFNRRALYANLTDPCVALPVGKNIDTLKKAPTLPIDIALLGFAAAKGLAHPTRGKHLVSTIDISPKGAVQFWRTGKPLMTGEAGMMATQTPLDMQATIAFFRRCRVNDEQVFRAILGNRPGVRFVRPEGGHGGGIDSKIIGNIAVRFGRIADQLEEGRRPDELDYKHVLHGLRQVA